MGWLRAPPSALRPCALTQPTSRPSASSTRHDPGPGASLYYARIVVTLFTPSGNRPRQACNAHRYVRHSLTNMLSFTAMALAALGHCSYPVVTKCSQMEQTIYERCR